MKIEIDKPVVPQWFDDWYKSFYGDKTHALHNLARVGWGYGLEDRENNEVEGYYTSLPKSPDFELGNDSLKEYFAKAILIGYEVEQEPLYYAKVKGWELLEVNHHWIYIKESKDFSVANVKFATDEMSKMTKEEWNKIGINDTNADFEEAE